MTSSAIRTSRVTRTSNVQGFVGARGLVCAVWRPVGGRQATTAGRGLSVRSVFSGEFVACRGLPSTRCGWVFIVGEPSSMGPPASMIRWMVSLRRTGSWALSSSAARASGGSEDGSGSCFRTRNGPLPDVRAAGVLSPAHQDEPRRGQFVSSSPFDSRVRGAGKPPTSIEGQHLPTGGSVGRGLLRFHDTVSVLEPAGHLADVVPDLICFLGRPPNAGRSSSVAVPQDRPPGGHDLDHQGKDVITPPVRVEQSVVLQVAVGRTHGRCSLRPLNDVAELGRFQDPPLQPAQPHDSMFAEDVLSCHPSHGPDRALPPVPLPVRTTPQPPVLRQPGAALLSRLFPPSTSRASIAAA